MPGSTTALALPYPLATEPVSQGDDAIKALADRIEAIIPRGRLGSAQVTTNQTGIGTGGAAITGLSVTVTVGAGRRIRVSGTLTARQMTVAGTPEVQILEGATTLQRNLYQAAANDFFTFVTWVELTPTAGTHTYFLRGVTTAGTLDTAVGTTFPGIILVEDIGV